MNVKECIPLEDEIRALHESLEEEKVATNFFNSTEHYNASSLSNRHKTTNRKVDKGTKRSKALKDMRYGAGETTSKKIRKTKLMPTDSPEMDDIDAHLEEIAERKNLSVLNVKNIIRNIIIDEHVVNLFTSEKPELEIPFEPKLTRSKVKELLENKNDFFLVPTSQSKSSLSDTRVLIEEEFPDDSSDDEYRPNEEESEPRSDDESFVSSQASDIGSPAPSWTSSIPSTYNIEDSLFKKPLPIENTQDDLIVYRTRSKLPLTDTTLEHLELAFVPPDITTDMYDSDCDDEEWAKFLKEFVSAPAQQPSEAGDDEEADPEYNILDDEEEVDSEELRADKAVRIPKDELEKLNLDLMAEEESGDDDESIVMSNLKFTPTEDILLSAVNEISQSTSNVLPHLEPLETTIPKLTGVQPLPAYQPLPQFPSNDLMLNIQYSTNGINHSFDVRCPAKSNEEACEIYPPEVLLPPDAKMRLEEQLRMHVQLLTQTNMIAAQDKKLTPVVKETRVMLLELTHFNPEHLNIANLDEAVQLTFEWGALMTSRPRKFAKRRSVYNYQRPVVESGLKNKKKFLKRASIHPERCEFDEDMVRLMMDSKVFIYPSLLPSRAVFENRRAPFQGSQHEDMLIAMTLEQFESHLENQLKIRKESIRSIACQLISDHVLPHHSSFYLQARISRLMKTSARRPDNPLQYYRLHRKAPPIANKELVPFDRNNVRKLRDVSPPRLPERWRVYPLRDLHRRSLTLPIDISIQLQNEPRPSPFDRSIFFLREKVIAFDESVGVLDDVTENSTNLAQDQGNGEGILSDSSAALPKEESLEAMPYSSEIFRDDNSPPSSVLESSPTSRHNSRRITPSSNKRLTRSNSLAKTKETGLRDGRKHRETRGPSIDNSLITTLPNRETSGIDSDREEENCNKSQKRKRHESDESYSETVSHLPKRKRGRPRKSTITENSVPVETCGSISGRKRSRSRKPTMTEIRATVATSGSLPEKRKRGRPRRPRADSTNASELCSTVGETSSTGRVRQSRRLQKEADAQSIDGSELLSDAETEQVTGRNSFKKSPNKAVTIISLDDSDEGEQNDTVLFGCKDAAKNQSGTTEDSSQSRGEAEDFQLTNNSVTKCLENDDLLPTEMECDDEHRYELTNNDSSSTENSREAFVEPVEVERQPEDTNVSGSSLNNSSTVKRFVLVKRDSNGLFCTHVWGPGHLQGNVIPVQTIADSQGHSASGSTSASTSEKGTSSSSVTQAPLSSAPTSGKQLLASSCGGNDGDDGDKRPEERLVSDAAEEPMAEDEEEEEESVQLDSLTATPRATQIAPSKGRSPAHRLVKNQRNASRILDSWMADQNSNATDYATAYFEKVTTALKKSPEAHIKFIRTLEGFDPDRPSEYILQLYNDISEILEPYPDLLEEFVVFIGSECAASCGKEFEYFLYSQMRNFFFEIKNCLRQSQLKRVLKALQQVENSETHSINDIKNAILPLLKGYSHLTNSFLKLFLDDVPAPSADFDFEEINLEQQVSGDEFEYVDLTEGATSSTGSNQGQGKENDTKSSSRRVVAGGSNKSNLTKGRGKGKALKK